MNSGGPREEKRKQGENSKKEDRDRVIRRLEQGTDRAKRNFTSDGHFAMSWQKP